MKAIVIHAAKDLRVEEQQPVQPGRGQVGIAGRRPRRASSPAASWFNWASVAATWRFRRTSSSARKSRIRGSFRFHEEFALAVDLINRRRVDVRPLLSDTFPIDDAVAAFELATDRRRSMKVQLAFA